jgi:predicted Ser/Thr protein kinase
LPGSDSFSDLLSLPAGTTGDHDAELVAGRYQLGVALGRGSSGTVYQAQDNFTGLTVAIKLMTVLAGKQRERLVREIGALRVLRVPGVVRLLDEGDWNGRSFIVMSLVDGTPFPGKSWDGTWASLEGTVVALLETLARVHSAGIIHRDIKPGNVLVNAQGQPTLLDFGLARGADRTITAIGTVVGTPRYIAPEQIHGRPVDARTDLYGLGVMIYEALVGEAPHNRETTPALFWAKDLRPRPLGRRARNAPLHVATLVDQLLEPDPRLRPRSAAVVLRALRGSKSVVVELGRLPRLGDGAQVDALVRAALDGKALDVAGPPGSGRTRTLNDVASRLRDLSMKVAWTEPARRPLQSLNSLWEEAGRRVDTPPDLSPEEVLQFVVRNVEGLLDEGWVLLVDNWERLDRWSQRVLQGCRSAGPVLGSRLAGDGDAVPLKALTVAELKVIFAGPERLFHLPEDGARELHQRTGGLQARVAAEIGAWVHRGSARWADGLLVLDRESLERSQMGLGQEQVQHHGDQREDLDEALQEVLAWVALGWPHTTIKLLASASGHPPWQVELEIEELALAGAIHRLEDGRIQPLVAATALQDWLGPRRRDAHLAVAEALPAGAEGRLVHFIAAGSTERVGQEAVELAERLIRAGRLGHATAILDEALFVVRRGKTPELLKELLTLRALVALLAQTAHGLKAAVLTVKRDVAEIPGVAEIEQLLRGALAFVKGKTLIANEILGGGDPLGDPRLGTLRHALRFHVSARMGEGTSGLVRVRGALGELPHPFAQVRLASIEGWVAYWEKDYRSAASHFGRSAQLAWAQSSRAIGLTKAASALIEAGALSEAAEIAREAIELAAGTRLALAEGRAEWCLRTACYRQGHPLPHDPDLLLALGRLGNDRLLGTVALVESAAAWRAGDLELARALAIQAQGAFESEQYKGSLLAEALAVVCGAPASRSGSELAALARRGIPSLVRLQILGLVFLADDTAVEVRAEARTLLADLSPAAPDIRREILSPRECVRGL